MYKFHPLIVVFFVFGLISCGPTPTMQNGIAAYDQGDYIKAEKIFKGLALKDNLEAQKKLAVMYDLGLGVEKNRVKAKELYMAAAEKGDADSQWNIGLIYQENPETRKLGQIWFEKSASQNNDERQLIIAFGYGLGNNFVEAAKWYEKAAALENADAQLQLGYLYREGKGVPKNFAQAFMWFQKAADQGLSEAHIYVGDMYELGEGVPLNLVRAHMHYSVAGSVYASNPKVMNSVVDVRRKDIEEKMTHEQIVEAQTIALAWMAEHKK